MPSKVSSSVLLKRPAAAVALSGCCVTHGVVGDLSSNATLWKGGDYCVDTKADLIRMGPVVVRFWLEAQGRCSRKRHREHAVAHSTGDENKVRKWAKLLDINLGKLVADPSREDGVAWWNKRKCELIEEIVATVERSQ